MARSNFDFPAEISNFGDVLSFRFAEEEVGEDVVEEFRVVVAGSLAVRTPVDLQDLGGHGCLVRIVPKNSTIDTALSWGRW